MSDSFEQSAGRSGLDIEVNERRDNYAVVRLRGELRRTDAEALHEQLHSRIAQRGSAMVIDLSKLKTIDSGGLSQLISLATHARLSQSRLVLVEPMPFVAGVLATTRLNEWFDMADSVEAADQQIQ